MQTKHNWEKSLYRALILDPKDQQKYDEFRKYFCSLPDDELITTLTCFWQSDDAELWSDAIHDEIYDRILTFEDADTITKIEQKISTLSFAELIMILKNAFKSSWKESIFTTIRPFENHFPPKLPPAFIDQGLPSAENIILVRKLADHLTGPLIRLYNSLSNMNSSLDNLLKL